MEILSERCAGLDVHKKKVKACVATPGEGGKRKKETRTSLTMTQDVWEMRDWLKEQGYTHSALEATGGYWKGSSNLLENDFEILVVNAHPSKTVPGRKTDVKDAEWIADLLSHGLLTARFLPSAPQRELRDLTRERAKLVEERAREVNRLQKTLEDTTLKLGDVVSDVMGKAAQMILRAVVDGETHAVRFADCAAGRVRANRETQERALTGKATAHHRFLLGEHLTQIEHLDEAIRRISEEITRRLTPPEPPPPQKEEHQPASSTAPSPTSPSSSAGSPDLRNWQQAVELIDQMTGISQRIAEGLLAEIGVNREHFPSAKHLACLSLGSAQAIRNVQANGFPARPAKAIPLPASF